MSTTILVAFPRRIRHPQQLLRNGFNGVQGCVNTMLGMGVSPKTGHVFPTMAALSVLVREDLRDVVQVVMKHPTPATLRLAFLVIERVERVAKRASCSMDKAYPIDLSSSWRLAMSGLRAGFEDIEAGLEAIVLLPSQASEYPEDD